MAPVQRRQQLERTDSEEEEADNTPCWKKFAQIMLSHVGLLLIVIGYAVGGAFIFISLETPQQDFDDKMKKYFTQNVADARKYIVLDMWYQSHQNLTAAQFQQLALEDIRMYHDYVVEGVANYFYDGTTDQRYVWTFSKAILATFSTIESIGYGQVCPKTFNGQMFAIIYGLIGVPLVLVFLADIGEFLARASRYTYSRGCCVVCRVRRRVSETIKGTKADSVFKEPVGNEPYMPTDEVQVPITVNVCVVGAYLALGGVLFKTWEGWAFSEAIYFSFVTLSTIGYGDFVPDNSSNLSKLAAIIKMTVTSAYTLFGMSLLSMCINLIQEQIITKAKWLAKELGINEHEDIDPAIKYKHRKTEGDVIITPAGKDGNKNLPNRIIDESHMKKFRRRYDNPDGEDENLTKLDEEE